MLRLPSSCRKAALYTRYKIAIHFWHDQMKLAAFSQD
jgi:hypothetical protein